VFGESLQPFSSPITLMSKQQFDSSTLQLDRFDGIARATYGGFNGTVDYALYAAQPALGFEFRERPDREPQLRLLESLVDRRLARRRHVAHYYDTLDSRRRFQSIGYSFGVGYKDECTTLTLRYSSSSSSQARSLIPERHCHGESLENQTLMIQLVLRTLGDVGRTSPLLAG